MPRLLVVHHTSSPALQAMLEAVIAGARDPELEKIDVAVTPALAVTVPTCSAQEATRSWHTEHLAGRTAR